MHFGQVKNTIGRAALPFCLLFSLLFVIACKDSATVPGIAFKFPEQGQSFGLGEDVKIGLDVPEGTTITSATYLLDGKAVATKPNGEAVSVNTKGLSLGYKLITAVVDNGSKKDTLTINIELKSALKPELYGYQVVKTLPHDTSAYTQGLEYHNGRFLESTGQEQHSTLRWVDVASGKVLQQIKLEDQYFGEGSSLVGDKVVMLTWQNKLGLIFDAKSFKQLSTFPYQSSMEGWGLCFDGIQLIKSDGTNRLWFLNKDTYKEERSIEVYDNNGPVDSLNELEYIDGKIYANVYTKNIIVVIDPESGVIEKQIDFSGLLPADYFKTDDERGNNVLNGIAWDKAGKRLFVTGKKWPHLFEVKLVPKK
ncbi:glutaminyl-peptide cyclotransferase [Pedobacter heparinus]|uniref:Glutamine cyclotransferase n=1 Tax=Pedobacter heparinus (strain ATCC 13125 / DSM 2366 / CIP 104194 / JCM 7457 / NBRC 12017 / NCIMB 9290 / NRRL B-14731 / HIM 762-3) TaxID=485917 RepID=C6XZ21_PEDHD|nr:glutaminyl-peptide cyclotransferase [Pedobacter heparinus]ACU02503.1 glutamine cyclotransferase [Pedobacter heparinus DSM 2366]